MNLVFVCSGNLIFSFDSIVEFDSQNTIQSHFDNLITRSIIIFNKIGSTVRCVQNLHTMYVPRTLNRTVPAYRRSVKFLKRTVPLYRTRIPLQKRHTIPAYRTSYQKMRLIVPYLRTVSYRNVLPFLLLNTCNFNKL